MLSTLAAASLAGLQCSTLLSGPTSSWTACPLRGGACLTTSLPTTAFMMLLANGTWPQVTDPFVDDTLSLVPDIAVTGPDYWTYTYSTTFTLGALQSCLAATGAAQQLSLTLSAYSYRANLSCNGMPIAPDTAAAGSMQAVGMFQRPVFTLTPAIQSWDPSAPQSLAITVYPPDYPGNTSHACQGCGQGGNHDIAKNVASQYTAGWDWIQGTPDRNTGVFGDIQLTASGAVLARDAQLVTYSLVFPTPGAWDTAAVNATVVVALKNLNTAASVTGILYFAIDGVAAAGGSGSMSVTLPPGNANATWIDVAFPPFQLNAVTPWWPHTLGAPYLYNISATFTVTGAAAPSTALAWQGGFRTVDSVIDTGSLSGRYFRMNGQRVFLQGGNYIASDQFNRYVTDDSRYSTEVRMHKEAGLNLLRLWGGSGGHGHGLFTAADQQGMFIMHEFWMSGDNNGRWAGDYSWPVDHRAYLSAVTDTLRFLRGHPSVLFYGGGNELYPWETNPPPDIGAALPVLIATLDSSNRTYVPSSMGSIQHMNASYALCPQDGPYGILDPRVFFTRNPGLHFPNISEQTKTMERAMDAVLRGSDGNVPIAFQPEIGSSSNPEYESMVLFLNATNLAAYPRAGSSYNNASAVWQYHVYEPFLNDQGVDTVYAYGSAVNASEYAARAALAQYTQYQAMYEGFQAAQWIWYGAMIMWKTNSPWPAFRGALYDNYGATNAALWGIRAATGGPGGSLVAFLHQGNFSAGVVNKGLSDVSRALILSATAWRISTGQQVTPQPVSFSLPGVPAGGVAYGGLLQWPAGLPQSAVLLWRLALTDAASGQQLYRNDYWLNSFNPDPSVPQQYAELDTLRMGGGAGSALVPSAVLSYSMDSNNAALMVTAQLNLPAAAPAVAFAMRVSLRYTAAGLAARGGSSSSREAAVVVSSGAADDRVLPAWASDRYFSLVPGESRAVTIEVQNWGGTPPAPGQLQVTVDGWNVPAVSYPL